ncbi:unnamed protein product, partial [Symbiodinium sp. KB8]
MGKVKLFPSPEYTSKAPRDPVVPKLPCTGVLLGPSKSGKTVVLISMILEQYRGCFERIYIFSPSINVDDGWRLVKKYVEETMKVPTDREQVYFEEWDEPALRQIIRQQRKITETSKQLKMRSLFQILVVIDDFADNPHLHKRSGDSALDTLFVRGRHFQISTLVSTQKLRLVSNTVRVNSQFFCVWRLRNQLEKDSLTALVPKPQLEAMYEEAVAETPPVRAPQMGQLLGTVCGKLLGSSTLFQSECRNINCCTSSAAAMRVYDPSKPPWMQQQWQPQQPWAPQTSADSAAS